MECDPLLAQVLLAEVERLRGLLKRNDLTCLEDSIDLKDPAILLEPAEGLDKKRFHSLRAYDGMGNLEGSINTRERRRLECEEQLDVLSESLRREFEEISTQIPAPSAWDEQLVKTLLRRALYWETGKPVPEDRTYTPDQSIDGDKHVIPTWGGYSLTLVNISPLQCRVVMEIHLTYRDFAEPLLPGLNQAMSDLKQANKTLIDDLEKVIHIQELRT